MLSLANDFLQRTLMLHDIFYLRHERVTRKMTMIVSNVSVWYTFFRERNNGRIRSWLWRRCNTPKRWRLSLPSFSSPVRVSNKIYQDMYWYCTDEVTIAWSVTVCSEDLKNVLVRLREVSFISRRKKSACKGWALISIQTRTSTQAHTHTYWLKALPACCSPPYWWKKYLVSWVWTDGIVQDARPFELWRSLRDGWHLD